MTTAAITRESGETLEIESAGALKVAMQALKQYGGLDPSKNRMPIRRIGEIVGLDFANRLVASGFARRLMIGNQTEDQLLTEISSFWSSNGLGQMKIVEREPLTIGIERCHDCLGWMTGVGVTTCPFKEGFLQALFEGVLKSKYSVEETECCGTLATGCKFRVMEKS